MIDIVSIFRGRTLDRDKLMQYGFSFSDNRYTKDFPIMENQYFVRISISPEGLADFNVYDAESNEEYIPARNHNATGVFIGDIHMSCEQIFKDISAKCYHAGPFKWEQTKRILRFIKDSYNVEPEFLWARFPECAAIRVSGKRQWFAALMMISKDKLGLGEDGFAEIINLKNEPEIVDIKVDGKKILPAYHMNKKHWYTLILDDRLSDDEIIKMVRKSYELVKKSFS